MSIELKIKSKHLATEPGIIRLEERRLKRQRKWAADKGASVTSFDSTISYLQRHRRWNVRNEARATHLARLYLADKSYALAEQKRENNALFYNFIVPRIIVMVEKYGGKRLTHDQVMKWAAIPTPVKKKKAVDNNIGLSQAA